MLTPGPVLTWIGRIAVIGFGLYLSGLVLMSDGLWEMLYMELAILPVMGGIWLVLGLSKGPY